MVGGGLFAVVFVVLSEGVDELAIRVGGEREPALADGGASD